MTTTTETSDAARPETPAAAGPIPVPATFPVAWPDPADTRLFWTHERVHFPDPTLPLDFAVSQYAWVWGMNAAAQHYDFPVHFRSQRINTYAYETQMPTVSTPEEAEAAGQRAQQRLGEAMGALRQTWDETFLPEIKARLAELRALDIAGASPERLLQDFDHTLTRARRFGEIHFLVVFPAYLAISLFDEVYNDLFGGDDPLAGYRLLQGLGNLTVDAGVELWKLSRVALAVPAVRQVLATTASGEVPAALAATAAGRDFLAQLDGYLAVYGQRGGDKWGIAHPSYVEDPTPLLKQLQDYVSQPGLDMPAEQAALAAQRERAVAAAREQLQGYPQAAREQFEFLLAAAQAGTVLSEDHGFWLDFAAAHEVRRILMELGRRFTAAGVIDRPEDVMYLTLDEVRQTITALPAGDRHALVAERRDEVTRFRAVPPPPAIGTPPAGPPPDNAMVRTMGKFFGVPVGRPGEAPEPGLLRGNPGSTGVARGPARVVRSLAEAARLRPGDVLVAETTAPPWTPLFATAVAVVTDTGGVLSHCAVVAREYGIPAVVGTGVATATIRDGQIVEVDGGAGTVRIVGD